MSAEEWRPIAGYEGLYSVSDQGRVRSEPRETPRGNRMYTIRGGILKSGKSGPRPYAYPRVGLWKDGEVTGQYVHIIVAMAFIGPRPEGMDVCHRDGVRENCAATNLRYDTHKNNQADMVAHGKSPRGA